MEDVASTAIITAGQRTVWNTSLSLFLFVCYMHTVMDALRPEEDLGYPDLSRSTLLPRKLELGCWL